MKQIYKPLKMRVVKGPHEDVLTASQENADQPYLNDIYGAEEWN